MSTYTIELQDVIEEVYGTEYDHHEWEQPYEAMTYEGIDYGKLPVLPDPKLIGLGTYPIFDETYRPILNGKIVDAFFTREIGQETMDMFFLTIRRKMDQIMPYFNKLYETEKINYSALDTMDIHSVGETKVVGEENATANIDSDTKVTSGTRSVNSDTPQTMLAGNADYATSGSDVNGVVETEVESANTSKNESEGVTNSDSRVTGYQGIASDLVVRYRNSLLNIDVAIIAELDTCFMQVLNNGDAYTAANYSFYPFGWWF